MLPHHNLASDQIQWIVTIGQIMDEESEIALDQPISIFEVPKPLLTIKPELYVPQILSLGPYHHFREDLQHMQRYKIASAKSVQNRLCELMKFQDLVGLFENLEYHIRAHYHRHLNLTGQTLAWMMAIDTSFLFEFLQRFAKTNTKSIQRIPSRMIHLLVDSKHRTTTHSLIIRDIIMLENQIPLFLLLKIAEIQIQLEETVTAMLAGFFKEISPFEKVQIMHTDIMKHPHLLDFLYCNVVPTYKEENCDPMEGDECGEPDNLSPTVVQTFVSSTKSFISDRIKSLVSLITKFLIRIPLRIMANIPILSMILNPVEQLLSGENEQDNEKHNEPLLEEILIPSVTEIISAGIKICPTNGGISTVYFCTKTASLHLPVIRLNIDSEVVLRNLVAYEASFGSRPLVFSRYIEFMNGIIDTEEDSRLLRKNGVILNYLKSDRDVAEMWNGMTRSIRLTRVPQLDCVIEEMNKYYSSRWRVILRKFFARHEVLSLWKSIVWVTFGTALVLFLLGFQVFCLTHRCLPWSRSGRSP